MTFSFNTLFILLFRLSTSSKYTIWTKVLEHVHIKPTGTFMTSISNSKGINMKLDYSYNSLHSSGKAFYSIFGMCVGIFAHSSRMAFISSDVGKEDLAFNLFSSSTQRWCSMGLRSGLCLDQSNSSTPNSSSHVFMNLALCTGAQSSWKEGGFP